LYTFYTVNLAEGEILNPLYLLHQQLYNYCQENNIALLDLGIATDKGVENVGLINFKKQLGAIPTKKITWIKYIS
jgi:lipid II:glycine glycyltransferase (peptidoglycan interpeptide bridge formation enzyme)